MKKIIFALITVISILPAHAQKEQQLNEVTVIASRTTNSAEGYSTNLRGAEIVKGKPVTDVLPFLPNISREQGNFKINGLPVSEIYIDGVRLTDPKELDNIPGEMIDKVQVKYLASADQNAGLSGGTIMITLRRAPEGGYYGSLTADVDWYRSSGFGNEGLGGLINYRYKDLSIYDNMYVGETKTKETLDQWVTGSDTQSSMTESSESSGPNFRNRFSIAQQFKSGAQLGGSYFISTTRLSPNSMAIDNGVVSSVNKHINTLSQEGTVHFSMPLNKRGASMELKMDYFNRHNNEMAKYNFDFEKLGESSNKSNLNLWKIKADFIYPQSRILSWKFGASAQWINSTHTPNVNLVTNRFELSDIHSKTNGFTPIVYAAVQGRIWKLRYSAGINGQINRIYYKDITNDKENHNTQFALNPTIQVMMPFGSQMNHALMLSYKRTLSDIPYTAISSVINWIDPYNYTVGNPSLKAQSSDMLMAGLSFLRNKINISAIYAHSHNRIYWQSFQDSENSEVYYTKPINISGQGVWGVGVEWIESPVKWWKFKLSGRIEISPEDLTINGTHYGKTRCKEYFYFNNNFYFGNGWGGMLNANIEPTYHNLDRTYHTVYDITGRIYKSFLKDNLQVAVDFTPAGNRRKLDREIGGNIVSYKYTAPVQYVGLSLTWNFSGGKKVDVNVVDGIQDYHETKDNR